MKQKNIIYVYADDLGRGMLSCYGQTYFQTKNIQRIVDRGMLFNNSYATAFCAPARASLMCGIHDAHAGGWTYTPGAYFKKISTGELSYNEVQEVLQNVGIDHKGEYIATIAKKAGYVTAEIGKLEWGFSTSPEDMKKHGWDYHYGYYDHIRCHGYYPPFLFENGEMVNIEGNTDPHCGRRQYQDVIDCSDVDMTNRKVYSRDLFDEKMISFIREHKDEKFFLFHPSQLPHGPIFYPDINEQVRDREDLTTAEKEYASMVLRLDETVGKLLDEVERLGLTEDTIFFFSADNGHTIDYQNPGRTSKTKQLDGTAVNDLDVPFRTETCGDVFNGNSGLAGLKFTNWNGGCCVPLMAMCPGLIPAGETNDVLVSNYDTMATIADIVNVEVPKNTDGISFFPILRNENNPKTHEYVIYACKDGPAIMTQDGWKLRCFIPKELLKASQTSILSVDERVKFQLYNWKNDLEERNDLSGNYPEIVKDLKRKLICECDGNLYHGTPNAHHAHPAYPVPVWQEITKNII